MKSENNPVPSLTTGTSVQLIDISALTEKLIAQKLAPHAEQRRF